MATHDFFALIKYGNVRRCKKRENLDQGGRRLPGLPDLPDGP
jgi:hypothetical protein